MTPAKDVGQLSRAVLGDKGGIVAVFKIYMDESGIHDGSPVVTVAAYLARPRDWQAWAKKWNVTKRPIKVYHAADAQNLLGEFSSWSEAERDELVKTTRADLPNIHVVRDCTCPYSATRSPSRIWHACAKQVSTASNAYGQLSSDRRNVNSRETVLVTGEPAT